jgi:hypothetical protein
MFIFAPQVVRGWMEEGKFREPVSEPKRAREPDFYVNSRFPNPPAKTFIRLAASQGAAPASPHGSVESLLHKGG